MASMFLEKEGYCPSLVKEKLCLVSGSRIVAPFERSCWWHSRKGRQWQSKYTGTPSEPGDLFASIVLRAFKHSFTVKRPSQDALESSSIRTEFSPGKTRDCRCNYVLVCCCIVHYKSQHILGEYHCQVVLSARQSWLITLRLKCRFSKSKNYFNFFFTFVASASFGPQGSSFGFILNRRKLFPSPLFPRSVVALIHLLKWGTSSFPFFFSWGT